MDEKHYYQITFKGMSLHLSTFPNIKLIGGNFPNFREFAQTLSAYQHMLLLFSFCSHCQKQ